MAQIPHRLTQRDLLRRRLGAGDGKLYVYFVNVGQGDCTFIVMPNGKMALIDCGSVSQPEAATGGSVASKLAQWGLSRNKPYLDLLVLTHPDKDHFNAVRYALGNSAVIDQLVHSTSIGKYWNAGFQTWLQQRASVASEEEINVNAASPYPLALLDGTAQNGAACELTCYASNVKATSNQGLPWVANTISVVTRLRFGNDSILMLADATTDTEDFLLKKFAQFMPSRVARVGHHGSLTSSGAGFVNTVSAPTAWISVAQKNTFYLPKQSVVNRWAGRAATALGHSLFYYLDNGGGTGPNSNDPFAATYTTQVRETSADGDGVLSFDGK